MNASLDTIPTAFEKMQTQFEEIILPALALAGIQPHEVKLGLNSVGGVVGIDTNSPQILKRVEGVVARLREEGKLESFPPFAFERKQARLQTCDVVTQKDSQKPPINKVVDLLKWKAEREK